MTGEEFEARVDAIIASYPAPCHAVHRALDLLTNELLTGMGGGFARGTKRWLAAIEGDHDEGRAYPLAPCGEHPKGEDAERLRAKPADAVTPKAAGALTC